jgi:hypothetical protein
MIDPFRGYGYGLQREKENCDHPKGNHDEGGTGDDGDGVRFTLEGLRVHIDVSEGMAVHG